MWTGRKTPKRTHARQEASTDGMGAFGDLLDAECGDRRMTVGRLFAWGVALTA